ncbi:sarcosine oxidase subunit beta [Pseudomonas borbori]|uniref:Sarcosine oxidase subunit beta n=1 Tax=Pseudomonas borbori TaxID=289003 RepID=A0A1I5LKM8_9PSED|nr:sarcosine oxidase subunit beta [Pseudomonas borbori]
MSVAQSDVLIVGGGLMGAAPQMANLNIIRTWSGIESYLPDSLPIMEPSGTIDRLYYAFGFSGHGFQLGPGVGGVMAELISSGSTSTAIEPFHIRRFATSSLQRSKAS